MNADKDSPAPAPVWSSEARSLASLLIFAHLFALVVAVTTYTRPSELQVRLHDLFSLYLRNLHITAYPVSYPFARYYLTHSLPTDVDFSCEVEFTNSEGMVEKIAIPPADLQPFVRERRYQAIANAAGTLADAEANEDQSSILPKAIAGSILKRHGASQGTVKLIAHYLPQLEDMGEVVAGRRQPPVNVTYEAQVFTSGGNVELLKKSTTLEIAPVERRSSRPNGSKPAGKATETKDFTKP